MPAATPEYTPFASCPSINEMAQSVDWESSPFGDPSTWTPQLRESVRLMLKAKHPVFITWQPDDGILYNSEVIKLLGDKYPSSFAKRGPEIWPVLWSQLKYLLAPVFSGEAIFIENARMDVIRGGVLEPGWFTLSFTPVYEGDVVKGAMGAVSETTDLLLAQHRQSFQLELADRLRDIRDPQEVIDRTAELLGKNLKASRVMFVDIEGGGGIATVRSCYAEEPLAPITGTYNVRDFGLDVREAVNHRKPRVFKDIREAAKLASPAYQAAYEALSVRAWITVPLIRDNALRSLLIIQQTVPRNWTKHEVALAEEVVERTWDAVERARVDKELRELNQTLAERVAERTEERDRLWNISMDLMAIGSTQGYFLSCNPAVSEALGWSSEALLAMPFTSLILNDEHDKLSYALGELAKGRTVSELKVHSHTKDGGLRFLSWTAVPHGDTFYMVGRDITSETEQAEALQRSAEALKQAQKMEAIGQLTGGIAHDFNNLLGGLVGHVDILQMRLTQNRIGEMQHYLDVVRGITERATSLTHRLLAFSRRQTLAPRLTNVNDLVASVNEIVQASVGLSIQTHLELAADIWPTFCDAHQLENAVLNLAINARDAMPSGGTITIRTSNLRQKPVRGTASQSTEPEEYVVISVSDTGTGMPKEVMERAFDPFYTTKPIGQGTGLGLSMVQGFVKQSGGDVVLESIEGKGTTVHVKLRRFSGDVTQAAPVKTFKVTPARALKNANVLVVDDEGPLRKLLVETLNELGYNALAAENGRQGLEAFEQNKDIDILVTDVGLPGDMNGHELADAVRTLRQDLKVLFITGYSESAAIRSGQLEAGMELLTKPFTLNTFTEKLKVMLTTHVESPESESLQD